MGNLIYRRNHHFRIDDSQLKPEANKSDIINSLYVAIYDEFKGAQKNPKYQDMTYFSRMAALNEFAEQWLKDRGLA